MNVAPAGRPPWQPHVYRAHAAQASTKARSFGWFRLASREIDVRLSRAGANDSRTGSRRPGRDLRGGLQAGHVGEPMPLIAKRPHQSGVPDQHGTRWIDAERLAVPFELPAIDLRHCPAGGSECIRGGRYPPASAAGRSAQNNPGLHDDQLKTGETRTATMSRSIYSPMRMPASKPPATSSACGSSTVISTLRRAKPRETAAAPARSHAAGQYGARADAACRLASPASG